MAIRRKGKMKMAYFLVAVVAGSFKPFWCFCLLVTPRQSAGLNNNKGTIYKAVTSS